jgi:hypothetical protein
MNFTKAVRNLWAIGLKLTHLLNLLVVWTRSYTYVTKIECVPVKDAEMIDMMAMNRISLLSGVFSAISVDYIKAVSTNLRIG